MVTCGQLKLLYRYSPIPQETMIRAIHFDGVKYFILGSDVVVDILTQCWTGIRKGHMAWDK